MIDFNKKNLGKIFSRVKKSFTSMKDKKVRAESVINNHVLFATGAGAIPLPFLDFAAVTAIQLDMVKSLTNLYEENYSENVGKAFIASVTSTSLARMGASAIKAIPGIGSFLGGVSMSIMSGASTYALGNVIMRFYERGIGLDDIDTDAAKKIYEEELEKGKKVAEDLKRKKENQTSNSSTATPMEDLEDVEVEETEFSAPPPPKAEPENDVYAELMKLGELKEKGIISEEEFAKMKKDIIDKF